MQCYVGANGLVLHQFFQVALGDDQVKQFRPLIFFSMLILFLHLIHLALELHDLFQRVALGLFRLPRLVVGGLLWRRGLLEGVRMSGGVRNRRDHQLDCFDLPGGLHLS